MKKLLLIVLIFFSITSFAQPSDSYLLSEMNKGKMPGASFAIIKEGKRIYHKSLGKADTVTNQPVDEQTIFMQASVSKTVIATAVMQLWEKGEIDLDADINRYLSFAVRTPAFVNDSITPRMLLTHTSSIRDEWNTLESLYVYGDSPISLDSFLGNYFMPTGIYYSSQNFYTYKPGSKYEYSNVGATLAAYLVEVITGDKFSHYCDTAIFQKICMNSTSFLLSGISDPTKIARPYYTVNGVYYDAGLYGIAEYPSAQLRTTSTDFARFMSMYMQYGIYEGIRLLDSTTVDYILQQQTNAEATQGILFYSSVMNNGDKVWGHSGLQVGVSTAMFFSKEKKTGVIVMTNGDDATTGRMAISLAKTLYQYGITVTPGINDTFPPCSTTTSIPDVLASAEEVVIYPNPSNGLLNVRSPFDGYATVYDLQGRIVLTQQISSNANQVAMPDRSPSGVYLIKLTDRTKKQDIIKRFTVVR